MRHWSFSACSSVATSEEFKNFHNIHVPPSHLFSLSMQAFGMSQISSAQRIHVCNTKQMETMLI